jgi:acetoin utilization protein AcuB
MFVGDRMSHPVITVHPDLPIQEAHELMRKEHIRRMPVVDDRGRMVGIVSESDILKASPSQVTSLSIWELNYLVSKIEVENIMNRDVISVDVATPIEEAARIMADNKIGGLPVTKGSRLAGVITETDLFKIFLELFGSRESGVRLTVEVQNEPGELAKLTKAIFEAGGNILSLSTFLGSDSENSEVTLKVNGVTSVQLEKAVTPVVERILDLRETKS